MKKKDIYSMSKAFAFTLSIVFLIISIFRTEMNKETLTKLKPLLLQ